MSSETFEGWAILELMGHRKIAGRVSEQLVAGAPMIRVDIPNGDGFTTQFYAPGALYALTPTTEQTARRLVEPYEIPALPEHADDRCVSCDDRALPGQTMCVDCANAVEDHLRDKHEPNHDAEDLDGDEVDLGAF